uniref:Cyclic nucleotide-binding domain-containing protein n=1 Tax=Amphimedon queenslandica TaxID=400682 RepID=A0A1X7UY80_AMPQE
MKLINTLLRTAEAAEEADPIHLLKELKPGDVFGEDPVGLESDDTSNEVIFTAKTHCHVLALNKNELNEIMTNLSSERNVEKERRALQKRNGTIKI